MNIKGLNFELSCSACPEQYDVYDNKGNQVGYVRLRWGELRCDYPDVGGETIYQKEFGDNLQGSFDTANQRDKYLTIIAGKILQKIRYETE